jgi:hypothetical protein
MKVDVSDQTSPCFFDCHSQCRESPQVVAFFAEVEALHARTAYRNPGCRSEVTLLLQGAVKAAQSTCGAEEVEKIATARRLLQRAETMYYQEVQTKNRLVYVSGLILGVCGVILTPIVLLWLVGMVVESLQDSLPHTWGAHLHQGLLGVKGALPLNTVAPLIFFAGLGASASVLSRLKEIDLKDEPLKKMVLIAAAARPALAVIFASVIFVILSNDIIHFRLGADTPAAAAKLALIWVAAFLCGYSERFATDILAHVSFDAEQQPPPKN